MSIHPSRLIESNQNLGIFKKKNIIENYLINKYGEEKYIGILVLLMLNLIVVLIITTLY